MTDVGRIKSSWRLKANAAILVLATLFILPGCWVSSINGLEETALFHVDPDVVFEPLLIGTWRLTFENCTSIMTVTAKERTYNLQTIQQGEQCGDTEKPTYSQARLLKLDNHRFLDVFPRTDDVCDSCLGLHDIFLFELNADSLVLAPIDSDWLGKAVEQKTVALATVPGNTNQLTASSKDLKAFCRKYADDKEAFAPLPTFTRVSPASH
jgi:hypothetical protein